ANACWGPAFWPRGLVTGRAGRRGGWLARRDPPRKGTQTTRTRRAGSGMLLKILLCTQLAPARHVVQVGEKISTRRGCPLSRLNSDLSVEIPVSEITPPLREAEPGPGEAVPPPAAGGTPRRPGRRNHGQPRPQALAPSDPHPDPPSLAHHQHDTTIHGPETAPIRSATYSERRPIAIRCMTQRRRLTAGVTERPQGALWC